MNKTKIFQQEKLQMIAVNEQDTIPISTVKYTLIGNEAIGDVNDDGLKKLRQTIANTPSPNSREAKLIELKSIHNDVCRSLGIDPDECMKKSRVHRIANARHIAMAIARTIINDTESKGARYPYQLLADFYNLKNHSTVAYGCQVVYDGYKLDYSVRMSLADIVDNAIIEHVRNGALAIQSGKYANSLRSNKNKK